jgi:exodeoxyribonuclease V gamma subunit
VSGSYSPLLGPMLELLQSNRMQLLIETLCARLQQPEDPFEPTLVVVQSQGIGQWLKVELAKRLGIAANIECMLPAELIWRLYQRVLTNDLPNESPFSRQLMTWRLMQLLPDSSEPSIQQYLTDGTDHQLRLYQLSHAIAGLYDQYLIYRPDWIEAWEQNKEDAALPWQSQLWRELLQQPGMDPSLHRASLHRAFLNKLKTGDASLPSEINVLGISSLPAMHLETLLAVAEHQQVSVYFLNPSEHYWGDIQSEKDVAKKSIRQLLGKQGPLAEDDYLEVGNPLLSSTGKQGREFLELLLEADTVIPVDLFQPVTPNDMLGQIHADLLNLEFGGEFYSGDSGPTLQQKPTGDHSIQIHSTHSRMREVEVLLDQILGMLDRANGNLNPADIIVMAPDISTYAPFIQAVFQGKLPFSITDRPAVDESAMLVAFNKLLALPDSRLTASDVMDLLEIPNVADKFELGEADVSRLQYWVKEAGIRFEMDGNAKASKWQLPNEDYNTWRFGLDRLLMGLAMEPEAGLYAATAPLEVTPGDAELIGKLCHILDLLVLHREAMSGEHIAEQWQRIINNMLADLMLVSAEDEIAIAQLTDAVSTMVQQTEYSHFTEQISSRLFRYWLSEQLQQPPQNRGFVSGGITFATLVPMRSIPYQCVCLLGMNDREFPREDKPLSFDLMAGDYRKGDRSRRNDDRYLFLEALISAQQIFYVSYIGRGQKDNKEKPPSELVSELTDYLQRVYGSAPVLEHPLQPFNSVYFDPASAIRSYSQNWHKALTEQQAPEPFVNAQLPLRNEDALIHLDQLCRFYQNPAKYYFNERLGVYFREDDDDLKDTESFDLDALEKYQLADSAMHALLDDQSITDWIDRTKAGGQLLPGPMGEQQLKREVSLAEQIAFTALNIAGKEKTVAQFLIDLDGHRLTAEIPLLGGVHIAARTGALGAKQRLTAWIRHLALCANGYEQSTVMVYRDKHREAGREDIPPVSAEQAQLLLADLIEDFYVGIGKPLLFLPNAAFEFATTDSIATVKKKFLDDSPGSEFHDRYYSRAFDLPSDLDGQFREIANRVWQPLIQHMAQHSIQHSIHNPSEQEQ